MIRALLARLDRWHQARVRWELDRLFDRIFPDPKSGWKHVFCNQRTSPCRCAFAAEADYEKYGDLFVEVDINHDR